MDLTTLCCYIIVCLNAKLFLEFYYFSALIGLDVIAVCNKIIAHSYYDNCLWTLFRPSLLHKQLFCLRY